MRGRCWQCGGRAPITCEGCKRHDRNVKVTAFSMLLLIALLVLGGQIWHASWAYGDWTCAFKKCLVVKP